MSALLSSVAVSIIDGRAGLGADVRPYSFRHTVARWLRSKKVALEDIQLQLGNTLPPFTTRHVGFAPDYLEGVKEAIDALFAAIGVTGSMLEQRLRDSGVTMPLSQYVHPAA